MKKRALNELGLWKTFNTLLEFNIFTLGPPKQVGYGGILFVIALLI